MSALSLAREGAGTSRLCLGTMTFGEQNSAAEAFSQLDLALERGIRFIDTAEMYPVMPRAETCHRTEEIVGAWLARQDRSRVMVATKIAGPSRMPWIREGSFDAAGFRAAVEGSLARLRTDYIDLYQIHWPARNVPVFGATRFDPQAEREAMSVREQLEVLGEFVSAGKIRAIGVSNESCWGVSEFVRVADEFGLPRIATIQNPYNLLNRAYEQGLDETCFRSNVSLLAYSPLAFGQLSGKYLTPEGAGRLTLFPPNWSPRYLRAKTVEATVRYVDLARRNGLTPVQLALGFVASRWFVGATILGATSVEQLEENIEACATPITPELEAAIDAIHASLPNPAQ
ncbi:MAG: aldo/keto reductase [Burkholderiaceae bacterium]